MRSFLYILAGLSGGILGGMGMGGGTLLIPLLTIFLSVEQKSAQAINLISFIPMSIVALIIHFSNGLVEIKKGIILIISGIFGCVAGSIFAGLIKGEVLKRCFGGFLVALAIFQILEKLIKNHKIRKKVSK